MTRLLLAIAAIQMSACAGMRAAAFTAPAPTPRNIPVCSGYGCANIDTVRLDEAEWRAVRARFHPRADSPAAERRLLAGAIGQLERSVGPKTGTEGDKGGTFPGMFEAGQMDWVSGPLAGMEPGPDGEGAALLYELMTHITEPRFTYTHDWDRGDLVIYDNRSLLHAPSWYEADKHIRIMWRTTVMGNPGPEYAGEERSWIPKAVTRSTDGPEARGGRSSSP